MPSQNDTSTASDLAGRVERYVREFGLSEPGDRILVACSGGSDSTALLDLMRTLSGRLDITLGVVHVDHGQHPDSGKPLGRVKARCRRWRIPFHAAVLGGERLPPGASEARMRHERYRAFEAVAGEHGYGRVATGHTLDDQIETVLMRIVRGTSTAGLAGIPPKRARLYIRPLLICRSAELLRHLKSRRLGWYEDPTNRDRSFLRNRIRTEILPWLRDIANPGVDEAILRLSRSASRDNDLLQQMAAALTPPHPGTDGVALPASILDNVHDAVLGRVLVRMLLQTCGPGANLEQVHVERLLDAFRIRDRRGFSLDLPGGVRAGVKEGVLFLRRRNEETSAGFHLEVQEVGEIALPDGETRMRFQHQDRCDPGAASRHLVFFDADAIRFPLVVRSLLPGDRLRPWGSSGSRKVARMLVDAKIPRHLRPRVPLLVHAGHVLWVAGLRRSNHAPVTSGTRRVLAVQLIDDRCQNR